MKSEFERDLEKTIELLQDNNVTEEGKEKVYDAFVEKYPYFETTKLDKYFM